jgi:hypothetical protein
MISEEVLNAGEKLLEAIAELPNDELKLAITDAYMKFVELLNAHVDRVAETQGPTSGRMQ